MPQPSAAMSVPISALDKHLVEARALDVQDLPLSGRIAWKRRSRPAWRSRRRCLPRRCRARFAGIARLAVGELAGEGRIVELALADDLARLARGLARLGGDDGLLDDLPRAVCGFSSKN
jgi:hypothetical protein